MERMIDRQRGTKWNRWHKKENNRHRDRQRDWERQTNRTADMQDDRQTSLETNKPTDSSYWQTGLQTREQNDSQTGRVTDRRLHIERNRQASSECHWGQRARQVERQTLAGFPGLTVGHVIEDVLHGPAVRQAAVRQLSVTLLPTLTLMSVKQENELLLDQLPLLRVSHRGCHRLRKTNSHENSPRRRLTQRPIVLLCSVLDLLPLKYHTSASPHCKQLFIHHRSLGYDILTIYNQVTNTTRQFTR